ncbi:MAG: hypothetical protein VB012_05725 [Erysipelotrichaceae bacterium]|nr:hypothetical protein [Erysipelotrichaceae bacterium]
MSIAISALIFVMVIFSFTFVLFDINSAGKLRQILFENTRAATQSGLAEVHEQYNDGDSISSMRMLELWLANFVDQNLGTIDELEISFSRIETEPPLYLVAVKGKRSAQAYISADFYDEVISGSTIISD